MSEITLTDRRSINEFSALIELCKNLIVKREDIMEKTETLQTNAEGYRFISAMMKTDKIDSYVISQSDLNNLKGIVQDYVDKGKDEYKDYLPLLQTALPDNIPAEVSDLVLDYKRYQEYLRYMEVGDLNPYYKDIYDKYIKDKEYFYTSLDDFRENNVLCFYVQARLAKNYSILYAPDNILSETDLAIFKQCYNSSLVYFMKVLYNEAYRIGNDRYDSFATLMIVFMTLLRYINKRLENIDDIDLFDEYSIRNLFLSYGLDYFFDMPLNYQKRILKNVNYLIRNKGTDRSLVSVLDLFGFSNIKIFRYLLTKDYKTDGNTGELMLDKPELKFLALSSDYRNNIEDAIENSIEYSYNYITDGDPLWQMDEEDKKTLINEGFNYIYTKYIDITSVMNILEYSMDFANFYNLLHTINKNYKAAGKEYPLYFYNYKITTKKIDLLDAVLLLQQLFLKKYGYKDNIIKSPTGVYKVYGYNFNELVDNVYLYKDTFYTSEALNNLRENKLVEPNYYNLNKNDFVNIFLKNKDFRKSLEKKIIAEKDYKTYRQMMKFYDSLFISEYRQELFEGFNTYTEYFESVNPDINKFLNNIESKFVKNPNTDEYAPDVERERSLYYDSIIMDLASSIDTYIDSNKISMFIQGNQYVLDYIKEFMYQLIEFIRSYTIHIREINTLFIMDDKFSQLVKLLDECYVKAKLSSPQLLNIKELVGTHSEFDIGYDFHKCIDNFLISAVHKFIDEVGIRGPEGDELILQAMVYWLDYHFDMTEKLEFKQVVEKLNDEYLFNNKNDYNDVAKLETTLDYIKDNIDLIDGDIDFKCHTFYYFYVLLCIYDKLKFDGKETRYERLTINEILDIVHEMYVEDDVLKKENVDIISYLRPAELVNPLEQKLKFDEFEIVKSDIGLTDTMIKLLSLILKTRLDMKDEFDLSQFEVTERGLMSFNSDMSIISSKSLSEQLINKMPNIKLVSKTIEDSKKIIIDSDDLNLVDNRLYILIDVYVTDTYKFNNMRIFVDDKEISMNNIEYDGLHYYVIANGITSYNEVSVVLDNYEIIEEREL